MAMNRVVSLQPFLEKSHSKTVPFFSVFANCETNLEKQDVNQGTTLSIATQS